MMFPSSQRVRYRHSPLVEVIAQLRFPAILRIERDPPVDVQETLRAALPSYQRMDLTPVAIVAGGREVALDSRNQEDRRIEHVFLSIDGQLRATLGRDFVALASRSYPGWESFSSCLEKIVNAVCATYVPVHIERVGLRYQNLIRRQRLGLERTPWRELLRPSLAGLLTEAELAPSHLVTEVGYELEQEARVRIAHGLVRVEQEESYLIDSDFFLEGARPIAVALDRLGALHEQAGSSFRWCISQALHQAMDPEPIP